jgi:hypothetical protein
MPLSSAIADHPGSLARTLLCVAPLNLPPLPLADTSSVQWLAGIAPVQGAAQYGMSRRVRLITSLRFI